MTLESKVREKALRNTMEVEDLLEVAKCGTASDAVWLESLSEICHWSMETYVDSRHVVPLAR